MKKSRQDKPEVKDFLAYMRGQTPEEVRSRIRATVLTAHVAIARSERGVSRGRSNEDEPIEYSMLNWTIH